jgi:hypothetical protein
MASIVDIANLALGFVGANPITSMEDASTTAELCSRFYPQARDHALEDGDWSFASVRAGGVAAAATAPAFGFTYRYLKPSEAITIREVRDASGSLITNWKEEDGYVLTNQAAPIAWRYTRRLEDPTVFPPSFAEAIGYRLASLITISINENRQLKSDLLQEYSVALQKALLADGTRKTKDTTPTPSASPVDSTTGATTDAAGQVLYIPESIRAR